MSIRKVISKIIAGGDDTQPKSDGFNDYSKSYAQSGEDLIIKFALSELKINKPTYLDIGAHHPWYLSNTALFYKEGCRGVLIEPDPELFSYIEKFRAEDTCLNAGIGVGKEETADFFIMSSRTLNTFSKQDAERYTESGNQRIEKIISLPLLNINKVIEKYFNAAPDLVSLDTEGFDLFILQSLDLNKYRPKVFCIETLTYTENKTEEKVKPVIDFMLSNNYMIYGDTYINTIFVDIISWKAR